MTPLTPVQKVELFLSTCAGPTPGWCELAALLMDARAEIERLTKERDELLQRIDKLTKGADDGTVRVDPTR